MKKETRIKVLLLFASILLLFRVWVGLDFNMHAVSFSEVMSSPVDIETLKSERKERTKDIQLDLFFNEQQLVYDEATKTYFYSITGDGTEAYNPRIEMQAHQAANYQISLVGEPISPTTIRENNNPKIFIYGDDWYQEFHLAVTTLPILSVELDDPITNKEVTDKNQDATLSLWNPDPAATTTQRHVVTKAQIRLRGASSRIHPQKQFRLSLKIMSLGRNIRNNHLSLLDMREDDDWILYAPYNDAEKARNTLSNNLWHDTMADNNPFGITNGTEGRFVELFINQQYWGVYTQMHPIDPKQLGLEENEDPRKSDYYYRMISNLPIDYTKFDGSVTANVISPVEIRFPENTADDLAKWEPFIQHKKMMNDKAAEGLAYMQEQTHLENQIDYWLFFMLTQAHDNDSKNRNYIAKHDGEKYVVLESPWDLDLTWGNNWSDLEELRTIYLNQPQQNPLLFPSFVTWNVQQQNQEIIQQVQERYQTLRETTWSDGAMTERLAQMEADIYGSGAILRNREKWPRAAFAPSMDSFQTYVMTRLEMMDQYIFQELGEFDE